MTKNTNQKARTIGLLGAISIGIGGMVGGGIFAVLGEAVSFAHGATAMAFLFAGVVALLTSYSYAKLSVKFQSQGGTVTFIDKAFNHNLLSGSINLLLWLSYLVTIALYAVAFSSYAQTFFTDNSPFGLNTQFLNHLFISLAIILPLAINLISASIVGKSETIIVVIKVALLIIVIAASASFVDVERLSYQQWGSSLSIVIAGMVIFVAYEGFELIANASEDIKNPDVNLPRAFYGSVLLVVILYVLIAIITVGTVPENELLSAKDYALAVAAKPALGAVGFTVVSIAALLATFSAINATIYGNSRLGYIIAVEGELPKVMDFEKRSIPFMGVILTAVLSLLIANSISLREISIIGSASFLLVFFIVNIAAYRLRDQINANKIIILFASLVSFAALVALLVHTYQNNPGAIVVFILFIFASVMFEAFYGKLVRKHLFNRPYKDEGKDKS
jgi:amino acid transporter